MCLRTSKTNLAGLFIIINVLLSRHRVARDKLAARGATRQVRLMAAYDIMLNGRVLARHK